MAVKNKLGELAWENFCSENLGKSWTTYWRHGGRFDLFVSIDKKNTGEPYPLSVRKAPFYKSGEENCEGWNIPRRYAVVGVYLGRQVTSEGQKRTKMVFATPTANEKYKIYVAHSGIVDWMGGGDDEPCEQSGIRVDGLWIANPKNVRAIEKRFGKRFGELTPMANGG
ncbi:hypothetical protein CMI41_00290 [Candidatus Pacearchaeota archaeon]|nr:hypothetical protein [Candidatus Pacearchaeota archaeon]|tara:strand:+ start:8855 stop:9358 length:504 start_codon:yes stop_codon:yes gene_type:complete